MLLARLVFSLIRLSLKKAEPEVPGPHSIAGTRRRNSARAAGSACLPDRAGRPHSERVGEHSADLPSTTTAGDPVLGATAAFAKAPNLGFNPSCSPSHELSYTKKTAERGDGYFKWRQAGG